MPQRKAPPPTANSLDEGFMPIERRLLHLAAGGERGFLLLRLLLSAVLFFQCVTSEGRLRWVALLPAAYGAAAWLVYRLRKSGRLSDALSLATFLLDVAVSLVVFHLTASDPSATFTVLLLVLLGSSFLKKPILVFSLSVAACLLYGLLILPAAAEFAQVFLIRMALFLLITLFSVHIAEYAATIERETARRYEERLAWMQRLSMVGRAMAAVLHEAKTPLGTIVLSAEAAEEALREKKDPGRELRVIAEQADQATAILQNFLDFVKPTRLDLQPLDVRESLTQALEMAKIRLDERGVRLELKTLEDCRVRGSSRHLVQAFTNILQNAVDAMGSGGELDILMEKGADEVLIHFRDNGAGMRPEALARLFEPFSTSKSADEGHGLGLSIVRWILHEHGGDIEVESPGAGRGSHVTLVLPLDKKS